MTDIRKLAESTSETVRDLVSQVIVKHEIAALEIMHELKAENLRLRAALGEIAWSNDSEWQADRAREALGGGAESTKV